ncbi:hypothetical protein [Microbacterium tumbae]
MVSNPQESPDEERRVEAEGADPDIPTAHPEQPSPAEEEDDEQIDVEDLP